MPETLDVPRSLRRAAWWLLAAAALYLPASLLLGLEFRTVRLVANSLFFAIAVGTSALAWWRGGVLLGRGGRAWRWIAAGVAAYALGRAHVVGHLLEGHPMAVPSFQDVAHVAFVVCTASGLLRMQAAGSRALKVRLALDATIVGAAVLFLILGTPTGRAAGLGGASWSLLALLHPVGDIALLAVAVVTVGRATGGRRPLGLLLAGVTCIAVANLAALYLHLLDPFAGPAPAEPGLDIALSILLLALAPPAGLGLIALASVSDVLVDRLRAPAPSAAAALAPVAAAAVGAATAAAWAIGDEPVSDLQLTVAAVGVLLVLLRSAALSVQEGALRREAEEALRRAEEVEEQRRLLLRSISHDISNPLTPIEFQLAVLQMRNEDPSLAGALAIISRNLAQVKRLARDLSDVSRAKGTVMEMERKRADVAAVVRDVVESESPNAHGRGVQLHHETEEALADVDVTRVRQVVANLVRNALKFTPSGGRVHVTCRPSGDSVELVVRDTGRGMRPQDMAQLFQPFVQVGERADGEDRGTGLGLYISRTIVDAHGGTITAASEGPGLGSTFTVRLPRPGLPQPPQA